MYTFNLLEKTQTTQKVEVKGEKDTSIYYIFPLQKESDLVIILPLIINYCQKVDHPLSQCLGEILQAFYPSSTLVLIAIKDGLPIGYSCSYAIGGGKVWFMSQVYSDDPIATKIGQEVIERYGRSFGAITCQAHANYDPKLAEHFGFKPKFYIMEKSLTD